jgi:hypothetical protein
MADFTDYRNPTAIAAVTLVRTTSRKDTNQFGEVGIRPEKKLTISRINFAFFGLGLRLFKDTGFIHCA